MEDITEIKYLEYGAKLQTYCPHCHRGLNKKYPRDKSEFVELGIEYNKNKGKLKLSPYLNIFENEVSLDMPVGAEAEDVFCPYCKTSLMVEDHKCDLGDHKVAKILVSAFSRLLPFYICTRRGCRWHGLDPKDQGWLKIHIPRQKMPEQDPFMRVKNFDEVPLGLRADQAKLEANRCLQCPTPYCVEGCPVNIDIKGFIDKIREDDLMGAIKIIKDTNSLPAVCGRVCPQEIQCESKCILGRTEHPVAIGNLERFVADYERAMGVQIPTRPKPTGKNVAIIGSGPSGLTMAAEMARAGHGVVVFEALHELGGVLVYGIPEFRLPKEIVKKEIDYLKKLGVVFKTNHVIGKLFTVEELLNELKFDAVYIATGAGLPRFMKIPGENAPGVFSSNEYLTRMNLMKAYKFPDYDTPNPRARRMVVVGGGNVAMDCARTGLRAPGTEKVMLVYRRARNQMPARSEEIHHAEQEGVEFHLLTNPVKVIANRRGWVCGLECIKMELGEPDDSGRRRPIPIEGSEYVLDCDMVVIAIGTGPNEIMFQEGCEVKRNKWGYIDADAETGKTTMEGVWAGGDIVTGSATVILAMGAARQAAKEINEYLNNK